MVKGRKPKPDVLKVLEGNPGKRPVKPPLQRVERKLPEELVVSEAAQEEWHRLRPILESSGVVGEEDSISLVVLVESMTTFRAAVEDIRNRGVNVPGQRADTLVKNPAAQIARECSTTVLGIADQLGLTPSSRLALGLPLTDEPSLDDILAGDYS